jgi:hypothetical protein
MAKAATTKKPSTKAGSGKKSCGSKKTCKK